MRDDTRQQRQQQIEQAAYEVLEEKGYAGTTMLAIARKARASNETLYNWYGDKRKLFTALVARNAREVEMLLGERITAGGSPLETLALLGPRLLRLLTGTRAVALNRAAAADASGELGAALAQAGRETVAPLIGTVLERARTAGLLVFDETAEATDLYVSLLVGDLQIRRVIGRMAEPDDAWCQTRAELALARLRRLLAP
ncbi:TetR/AcrR family transcriptional regulator [Stappia sp.]|uniref:TetR/AcrR family transcriptional regulator n=1 Tax=Stappia sp. TaxID=1870903 RepID=UPI003D123027